MIQKDYPPMEPYRVKLSGPGFSVEAQRWPVDGEDIEGIHGHAVTGGMGDALTGALILLEADSSRGVGGLLAEIVESWHGWKSSSGVLGVGQAERAFRDAAENLRHAWSEHDDLRDAETKRQRLSEASHA